MSAPFYLVWGESTQVVTKMHRYHHDAVVEARRLAKNNPGQNFFVVASTDRFRKTEVEHERFDADEVPF